MGGGELCWKFGLTNSMTEREAGRDDLDWDGGRYWAGSEGDKVKRQWQKAVNGEERASIIKEAKSQGVSTFNDPNDLEKQN